MDVRSALLEEIRNYLPAFLRRDATEQHDPVGDVKELLNLEEGNLERVVAVHACLDEAVISFGKELAKGVRSPIAASRRPVEVTQAVRGPVDWSATTARRSLEGGNPSRFVVRSARRAYDVPENRALVWLLERIRTAAGTATIKKENSGAEGTVSWNSRIAQLRSQVEAAQQVDWLRGIRPEAPTRSTLRRLRAARRDFYRNRVSAAIGVFMGLDDPSDELLTDLLCRRYFEPAKDWMIFEVCVALRLARRFAQSSGRPRKARLMMGTKGKPYARYSYPDGSEVALILQAWPGEAGSSALVDAVKRHGLAAGRSRPDLFIVRSGSDPDVAILELKASYQPQYLREGLVRLLGYLAECPEVWKRQPSGWLVAPASEAFEDSDPEDGSLWLVSADQVADAAVARFAPAAD